MVSRSAIVLLVFGFVSTLCMAEDAMKAQYTLERSLDGNSWDKIATFSISRVESTAQPRLKLLSQNNAIDVAALASSSLLRYRAIADQPAFPVVSIVTSPCALIRGFDAISSKSLKMFERIGIVVGDGARVQGLQLSPSQNLHHANVKATECDSSILKLFSDVSIDVQVSLVKSVEQRIVTRFEDGPSAAGQQPQATKPAPKAESSGKDTNKEGEPQEDNRSFFEKYGTYIAIFAVWSLISNYLQPKAGAAGQAAPAKK